MEWGGFALSHLDTFTKKGPPNLCVRLISSLTHAVEHIHSKGLVWCDISTNNILFGERRFVLCDAGGAVEIGQSIREYSQDSKTGAAYGLGLEAEKATAYFDRVCIASVLITILMPDLWTSVALEYELEMNSFDTAGGNVIPNSEGIFVVSRVLRHLRGIKSSKPPVPTAMSAAAVAVASVSGGAADQKISVDQAWKHALCEILILTYESKDVETAAWGRNIRLLLQPIDSNELAALEELKAASVSPVPSSASSKN